MLETGDVIISRELNSPHSSLISLFTGSYYSHSAMYYADGLLVESMSEGVRLTDCKKELQKRDYVILRYKYVTPFLQESLKKASTTLLGKPYDYGTAINIFKNSLRRGKKGKENNGYLCSRFITECYRKCGISLFHNNDNPLPKDFLKNSYFEKITSDQCQTMSG